MNESSPSPLSRSWKLFLILSTLLGVFLRLSFVEDMEFKDDEHYNFIKTQLIGGVEPWPWVGMPSGAYFPNPGMSIWVFVWLARIVGAQDPTELARALQIFSLLGILLVLPFALRFVTPKNSSEREPWLWAFALAMVNPFAILYQRKLWPEPFFPFFSMVFLMGWWRRNQLWGAIVYGFIGACLGQIHMSGFFFAGAFFLWTLFAELRNQTEIKTRWIPWFLASAVASLPLIPWAISILKNGTGIPTGTQVSGRWDEIIQFKFWVFWVSDALGFHLGNPLGLLRGPSTWNQLSDFIRYPIIRGHATYLNGLAHLVILGVGGVVLGRIFWNLFQWIRNKIGALRPPLVQTLSSTSLAMSASFWGFGILLTLTGVMIRRYYMMVSFPFEFLWIVGILSFQNPDGSKKILSVRLLALLWLAQAFVSANFVGYIHVNQGSIQGDYGQAFHVVRENYLKQIGKPWPERPLF